MFLEGIINPDTDCFIYEQESGKSVPEFKMTAQGKYFPIEYRVRDCLEFKAVDLPGKRALLLLFRK